MLKAKKPLRIKDSEMSYDFSKELIQEITDENHIQKLLSTNKFDLIN